MQVWQDFSEGDADTMDAVILKSPRGIGNSTLSCKVNLCNSLKEYTENDKIYHN